MVYLDYSATTPVDKRVLESFEKTCTLYFANSNSLHDEGLKSKGLLNAAVSHVANLLNVKESEIIFTSGATEANNLAIMGVVNKYLTRGKTIITTKLEHSSVLKTVSYLEKNGYTIKYVSVKDDGHIDIDELKMMLTDDVVLVSISEVNSEIGLIQDVNMIGEILKGYPKIIYHVDGTAAIGKKHINLNNIDLYSFSAHKFYGLKGVGCLIKKDHIILEPLIHGGISQTEYRAGTPPLELIVSTAKALRLIMDDLDFNIKYVAELSNKLKEKLNNIDGIIVNSNDNCLPHIINISVEGIKPETLLHALSEKDIYISTKTACSKNDYSESVYALTKDMEKAKSSLRISLSHLTKESEIDYFVSNLSAVIKSLKSISD